MKVFIDSNIYINFYTGIFTNTSPLEELLSLIKKGQIELITTEQLINEVNRDRQIKAIKVKEDLAKLGEALKANLPDKRTSAPIWKEIKDLKEKYNKDVSRKFEEISKDVTKKIAPKGEVDKLVDKLFKQSTSYSITPSILNQAKYRYEIGNPPRKNDNSIGDAINWEILIDNTKKGEDLVIICNDGDYKTKNWEGESILKDFLSDEWTNRVGSNIKLYPQLTDFLLSLKKEAEVDTKEIEEAKVEEDLVSQYTGGYGFLPVDTGALGILSNQLGATLGNIQTPLTELSKGVSLQSVTDILKDSNEPILDSFKAITQNPVTEVIESIRATQQELRDSLKVNVGIQALKDFAINPVKGILEDREESQIKLTKPLGTTVTLDTSRLTIKQSNDKLKNNDIAQPVKSNT